MATPMVGAGNFPLPAKVPGRVLVVDREPLVRWALTTGLTVAGYDVLDAATRTDACEIAARVPHPAVVLIDLVPNDVQGQVFFDEIHRLAPTCRVIVLTTERRRGAPAEWRGAEVIEKPFDLAEVVRLVGEAFAVR